MFNLPAVYQPFPVLELNSIVPGRWYLVTSPARPNAELSDYTFNISWQSGKSTASLTYFLAKLSPVRKGNLQLCPHANVKLSIQTTTAGNKIEWGWTFVDAEDFYDGNVNRKALQTCFTVEFVTTNCDIMKVPLSEDGTGALLLMHGLNDIPLVLEIEGDLARNVVAALDYDATVHKNLQSLAYRHEILMQRIVA